MAIWLKIQGTTQLVFSWEPPPYPQQQLGFRVDLGFRANFENYLESEERK